MGYHEAMKSPRQPIVSAELKALTLTQLESGQKLEGVRVLEAALADIEAKAVTIESVVFESTEISASKLKTGRLSYVLFDNCLLFGSNFDGSDLHRVVLQKGNCSGIVLSDVLIEDVSFVGV